MLERNLRDRVTSLAFKHRKKGTKRIRIEFEPGVEQGVKTRKKEAINLLNSPRPSTLLIYALLLRQLGNGPGDVAYHC